MTSERIAPRKSCEGATSCRTAEFHRTATEVQQRRTDNKASRIDGTEVSHAEAVAAWAEGAYQELKLVAHTYNGTIRYMDLREVVQRTSGITTSMLMQHWIGSVLEIVAQKAADADEPPLTSLCVRTDDTIGDGYAHAPKFAQASTESEIESRAAEDRPLCYREYATDVPVGGGTVTLTPEVQSRRHEAAWWCYSCAIAVLLSE